MKKNDIILIAVILVVAAGLLFFIQRGKNKSNAETDWVVIQNGEKEYVRYPLHEDGTYEIEAVKGHKNILEIKDGKANMIEADCSDKICVHQAPISEVGEMIVCLPNQVIVTIESDKQGKNEK